MQDFVRRLCFQGTQATIAGTAILECDPSPARGDKDPILGDSGVVSGRWSGDTWSAASQLLRPLPVVNRDGVQAEGKVSGCVVAVVHKHYGNYGHCKGELAGVLRLVCLGSFEKRKGRK